MNTVGRQEETGRGRRQNAGRPVSLSRECSLKMLEEPCVYNKASDDLYIVSSEAFDFLRSCGGGRRLSEEETAFAGYCLQEGILTMEPVHEERVLKIRQSPVPSPRYLLIHITERCNLGCRHCYLGEAGAGELDPSSIKSIVDDFESWQGLRLMISGGEPLLHDDFWEINDYLTAKDLRVILMSNGTLFNRENVSRLSVQEVQISIDGAEAGHDLIRGSGSYKQSIASIGLLRETGTEVSVATMIHAFNLDEFDEMARLMQDLGVREWSVDLPAPTGRLAASSDLAIDPKTAAPYLDYSYGGSIHEPAPGYACGAHLIAVMADGSVAPCGFYAGKAVGSIDDGLAKCWQKKPVVRLAELDCDCEFIDECRGGCRFRAEALKETSAADLYQCYRYRVSGD